MEPAVALTTVETALEALIHCGQPYGGLFPGLIDRRQRRMLTELPPGIPGQRIGDRAFLGSNLMHDQPTLQTLYALGIALGRPAFTEAADAYLRRFATHCTATVTGLFPWGEHSFWQLVEDRVGDGSHHVNPGHRGSPVHDHLRQAPVWLWEKLYAFNPRCVERFAEGLDYHWVEGGRVEYNRHATIQLAAPWPQHPRACDFPRHAGFYILDWAFAWSKTGRPDFLQQIRDMLDYAWPHRDARGLLTLVSRETALRPAYAPAQTLSLGVSLLESAALLDGREPELAAILRQRGCVYLEGFLAAPHDLGRGVFVLACDCETDAVRDTMPVWGSQYGVWPAAYAALTALRGFALTGHDGLLAWGQAAGRAYAAAGFPADVAVPAMDAGLALGLQAELYAAWPAPGGDASGNLLRRSAPPRGGRNRLLRLADGPRVPAARPGPPGATGTGRH
jgi:hypothetical protein